MQTVLTRGNCTAARNQVVEFLAMQSSIVRKSGKVVWAMSSRPKKAKSCTENVSNARKDEVNLMKSLGCEKITADRRNSEMAAKHLIISSSFPLLTTQRTPSRQSDLILSLDRWGDIVSKMTIELWMTVSESGAGGSGLILTVSAYPRRRVDAGEFNNSTKECMLSLVRHRVWVWKK